MKTILKVSNLHLFSFPFIVALILLEMFEMEQRYGWIKICQNTRLHSFELITLSNNHCELYELDYRKLIMYNILTYICYAYSSLFN